ncbi:Nuclear protein Es2 family protein [Babesia bovis T2Bo]|uniref:Uncharacterized protein n=1 Tax=Babesia bovis TaxID=5865 RepID=A7AS13_BABBO|nr:Nuclear protein Es2 family protein [Babesia bovis T2Bo]EDO07332.1 Nuclear protein Es2 family protein [Babesia bovis T2Bo]|eukprot:XP_001610900.1 hypothetical protein [Babesia bovis T2Bo]
MDDGNMANSVSLGKLCNISRGTSTSGSHRRSPGFCSTDVADSDNADATFQEFTEQDATSSVDAVLSIDNSKSDTKKFENTILDPKVQIASLEKETNIDIIVSKKPDTTSKVLNNDSSAVACAKSKNDWRLNAVSTIQKEPLVPYDDVLQRIRRNYQLKELNEEDYVGCLESIIERDYFPGLMKLRVNNLLLEAESRGDQARVKYLKDKLQRLDDDNDEMNIKLRTTGNEDVVVNVGKGGLRIDEFSRIFTSEDNRSFGRLLEKSITQSNEKHSWMEGVARKHNLAIASNQVLTNLGISSGEVQSNKEHSRNALFFNKDYGINMPTTNKSQIRHNNTSMPSDHDEMISKLESRQKKRRAEHLKNAFHGKVNDLIAEFGLSECKDLIDQEQMAKYDFVQTPLISLGNDATYDVPKPIAREEIAERLRKKYQSTPLKTPLANTPHCKTPLLIQKLIAKHNKLTDPQLRSSYRSSKYSRGSVLSGPVSKP